MEQVEKIYVILVINDNYERVKFGDSNSPVALMGLIGKSRDPNSGILHIVKDP